MSSRRSEKMNMKKMDKVVQKALTDFKRKNLVLKKTKQSIPKMKSAGRNIAPLPPESWISAFVTFIIYAIPSNSGKVKKTLIKLLSEDYSESMIDNVVLLKESEDIESQMNVEELGLLLEELMLAAEQFDEEVEPSGNLTVRKLNEEVNKVKTNNLSVKEQKKLRFFQFFNLFEEKLRSLGIEGDDNIAEYLKKMTDAVYRVKIGGRSKDNGK